MIHEPFGCVDEDERDVGALGRLDGAKLRVVLDPLTLATFPAQTRGVDEEERAIAAPEHGVDRVARRARDVRDDDPFLSDERVQKARLADVRPTEDRDADRVLPDLLRARPRGARRRAGRADRRCRGRAGPRRGSARRARAGGTRARPPRAKGRPPCWPRRAPAGAPGGGDPAISSSPGVTPAFASTTKSTRSASSTARRACSATILRERRRVGDVDAAGVDEDEALAGPLAHDLLAIAGHPRRLEDDSLPRRSEAVDEGRLADVREADDRDRPEERRAQPGLRRDGGPPRRRPGRAGPAGACRRGTPTAAGSRSRSRRSQPCSPSSCADARRSASALPRRPRSDCASRASSPGFRRSPPGSPALPPESRPSPLPALRRPARRCAAAFPRRTSRATRSGGLPGGPA